MLVRGFHRFSVDYLRRLNRPHTITELCRRSLSHGAPSVPLEASADHKRTTHDNDKRLSTHYGPDKVLIEHENRKISISVYGIPRLFKERKALMRKDKEKLAERLKHIASVASNAATSDCVCLGIGRDDVKLMTRYLRGEEGPEMGEDEPKGNTDDDVGATKDLFGHYVPVMTSVLANKIPHVGIGRNGRVKMVGIADKLLTSKLEIPQWIYLQLKYPDLCNNKEGLLEASQLIPRIYYAFVTEESFYSMCRLHEEILTQGIFPNKNHVKLAVVVEEWVRPELSRLVKMELPGMLEKKMPPLKSDMDRIDGRSLGIRHFFSAIILLAPIVLGVPSLVFWLSRNIQTFKEMMNVKIIYKGVDPEDDDPCRD